MLTVMSNDGAKSSESFDGFVQVPDERQTEYVEQGHWEDILFHELIDRVEQEAPDRTAIISPERELTYGELATNTKQIAQSLSTELGLSAGDRLIVQLPNCIEYVETVFACSRIGVVPVLVLPRHREKEVRHLIELTDSRAMVTVADRYKTGFDHIGMVESFAGEYQHLEHTIAVSANGSSLPAGWVTFRALRSGETHKPERSTDPIDPSDPGLMLLSGGTTGLPKAIPRTHNDYIFHWKHLAELVGVETDWITIPGVPIEHSFAMAWVVGPTLWSGATLAVEPNLSPDALITLASKTGAEYLILVPTQLVDVFEDEALSQYDLPALEVITSGGQNVSQWLVEETVERWDVGFCQAFGMGEGVQISTRPDDELEVQANTVGKHVAAEATDLRIVNPDSKEPVTAGRTGELLVKGPGVFPGYFRNRSANEESFDDDGWFYTGDLFSQRDDGNYVVHGRIEETINRAGEIIYATSLEEELIEHPKIKNVCIVGIPDQRLGETPCAVVELNSQSKSLSLDEVTEFLDDRGIAVFKRPERLEVLDQLPRTSVGKIDKKSIESRIKR